MSLRYGWYRVLVINTHMGEALSHGIIAWCLKHIMPKANVILFQEVSPRHIPLLLKMLPPGWRLYPGHVNDSDATSGTNYLALKGKRFQKALMVDRDARHGSRHGRSTRGLIVYDTATRRWLVVSCLHPDPLGKGFADADPHARGRHIKQVKDTVAFHERSSDLEDAVHLSGGDVNEQMAPEAWMDMGRDLYPLTAGYLFQRQQMWQSVRLTRKRSGPTRLMEVFVGRGNGVRVMKTHSEDTPVEGMDHEVRAVWVRVRKGAR